MKKILFLLIFMQSIITSDLEKNLRNAIEANNFEEFYKLFMDESFDTSQSIDSQGRPVLLYALAYNATNIYNPLLSRITPGPDGYDGKFDDLLIKTIDLDLNIKDKFGKSALYYTIVAENIETFELLLQRDIQVTYSDIQQIIIQKSLNIFTILLKYQKDIDQIIEEKWGNTIIHWTSLAGNSEMCALLILKGADVNKRNKQGFTPLHFAAQKGLVPKVNSPQTLIPLFNVTEQDCLNTLNTLINGGANINAASNGGMTPIQIAHNLKLGAIERFLFTKINLAK